MKLISRTLSTVVPVLLAAVAFVGFIPASAANAASTVTLHQGVTSTYVPRLQFYLQLNRHGSYFTHGEYTMHFGPITATALRNWQQATSQPVTGTIIVGSTAWKRLKHEAVRHPVGLSKRAIADAKRYGHAIDANKATHRLYVLRFQRTTGRVIAKLGADARYGDARGSAYVTRNGDWTIYRKGGYNYVSSVYDVLMRYPSFFSGGEAIHYSDDFAAIGYASASHGCLNLRDMHVAKFINRQLALGTHVVIHGHI